MRHTALENGIDRAAAEMLRCYLLGGFRVAIGARLVPESAWRLRKARQTLVLLALAPGHTLHREQVQDWLWPELNAPAAANSLRYTLRVARRTLAPDAATGGRYLRLHDGKLVLCPEAPLWVDVEAFEAAAAEARRRGEPHLYQAAAALYTGDLLPEERYEDWAAARRAALRELYLSVLFEQAARQEARGEWPAAVETLQALVAAEPAHEDAHVELMRLHAAHGQRYQALRQYQQMREALWRELEAEPAAATQQLYAQLVAGRVPAVWTTSDGSLAIAERRIQFGVNGHGDGVGPAAHNTAADQPPGEIVAEQEGLGNLPVALTRLVGREEDARGVRELLGRTRLVTLTGAGGCGKTRLALEVAAIVQPAYPHGAWFADLGSLADPALVPQAVADALGLREQPPDRLLATLTHYLRTRQALLVVDNCEHLLAACAVLAAHLLPRCPCLHLLATSRRPLHVVGEAVWRVPPLAVPPADSPAALAACAAVALFVDRARLVQPRFALTPQTAPAVARICQALDGLPLALELAAARLGAVSVEQLAARLDARLRLLESGGRAGPARQQTLRATIDWSYALLSAEEQAVWRRLAGFAGGFTLAGARAVASGAGVSAERVEDVVAALVDQSMVTVEGEGAERRYGLLATLWEYGREQLARAGEAAAIAARHAAYCLALVQQGAPALRGPEQPEWLERLEREQDNLRAALAWSLAHRDDRTALQLAAGLWVYWQVRGQLTEGRSMLASVLATAGSSELHARVRVLRGAGHLAREQGDLGAARRLYEAALTLARALGADDDLAFGMLGLAQLAALQGDGQRVDALCAEALRLATTTGNERVPALGLLVLGRAARDQDDLEAAAALCTASLNRFQRLGDPQRIATAQLTLSQVARARRELGAAATHARAALDRFRTLGDARNVAMALHQLGRVAWDQGDYERALGLYRESLERFETIGVRRGVAACLTSLAMGPVREARWEDAGRLLAAAAHLRRALGTVASGWERSDYRQLVAAVRGALDEATCAAVWVAGEALTPEEAIALARGAPEPVRVAARC